VSSAVCAGLAIIMSPEPEATGEVIQYLKRLRDRDSKSGSS